MYYIVFKSINHNILLDKILPIKIQQKEMVRAWILEPGPLSSNLGFAIYQLCDFGQSLKLFVSQFLLL